MPVTPSRAARDAAAVEAARQAGLEANEKKYGEFYAACDGGAGSPGACNALGEWYAMLRRDFVSAAALYSSEAVEAAARTRSRTWGSR
jgi:hypothetical protein